MDQSYGKYSVVNFINFGFLFNGLFLNLLQGIGFTLPVNKMAVFNICKPTVLSLMDCMEVMQILRWSVDGSSDLHN